MLLTRTDGLYSVKMTRRKVEVVTPRRGIALKYLYVGVVRIIDVELYFRYCWSLSVVDEDL
jgi:hypothetical protein